MTAPAPGSPPRVALYVDPPSEHFLGDRLFASEPAGHTGEDTLAPFRAVRERLAARGIAVHTADLVARGRDERRLYLSLGGRRLVGRPGFVPSALFAFECPVVEPSLYRTLPALQRRFRRLFTWGDATALLPYTGEPVVGRPFRLPQASERVRAALWERRERRFLTMINANKQPRLARGELYSERRRAAACFARHGELDLYGPYWSDGPRRVGRSFLPATLRRLGERLWVVRQRLAPDPVYAACASADRGTVRSKLETLAGYRFALCYENAAIAGYLTEKIFDCFAAGTVPVYLGAPDVGEWIPEGCFVDRRAFGDDEELRRYLHALAPAEVESRREQARAFLDSPRSEPFRVDSFVRLVESIVDEDAGTPDAPAQPASASS